MKVGIGFVLVLLVSQMVAADSLPSLPESKVSSTKEESAAKPDEFKAVKDFEPLPPPKRAAAPKVEPVDSTSDSGSEEEQVVEEKARCKASVLTPTDRQSARRADKVGHSTGQSGGGEKVAVRTVYLKVQPSTSTTQERTHRPWLAPSPAVVTTVVVNVRPCTVVYQRPAPVVFYEREPHRCGGRIITVNHYSPGHRCH